MRQHHPFNLDQIKRVPSLLSGMGPGPDEPISFHAKSLNKSRICWHADLGSAGTSNILIRADKPAPQPVRCCHVHFAAGIFRPETIPGRYFLLAYSPRELDAGAQGFSANVPRG